MTDHCTCRPGRDHDGSEFGPCEFCERVSDNDRAQASILRDAARWRISQIVYPRTMDTPRGYFCVNADDDYSVWWRVGIQPHPITKAETVGGSVLGEGRTKGDAIDDMFVTLNRLVEEGADLPVEIESIRLLAASATDPAQSPNTPMGDGA